MVVFNYVAKDTAGQTFAGTYTDVESPDVLREELDKMGYTVLKVRRARKSAAKRRIRVNQAEVATFAFKFAGMFAAGLPVIRCLDTLEKQTDSPAFRGVLADIRDSVSTGTSLTSAFGKYRKVFSDFFLGMVEAGEVGGKLGETLEMSAVYLEKQVAMRRKVKAAFAYPVVVTVMCFLVIGFLLAFVIPVFAKLYQQVHAPMPGPTLVLMTLSTLVRERWWQVLIAAAAVAALLRRLLKSPGFRAWWDRLKLNLPIFGKLNRMVVTANFARTFAMLSGVGVSLIKSLEMASQVANNSKMTEISGELQKTIQAGADIAGSMKKYDIFPPVIVQLAGAGEEVGALPDMLNKGADLLDKDIDRMISGLLVKLEPALTLVMGAVVGFILMGAYLPMFDYIGHLR